MKKIGITGNIASGKTAVENIIADNGFKILDADFVCHKAFENDKIVINKVIDLFKNFDVIDKNNKLDRTKIGQIVFSDSDYKKKLEDIKSEALFCNTSIPSSFAKFIKSSFSSG